MIEIDSRCDFPVLFKELGNIKTGIELGVSHGDYAKFLLDNYDSWDMLYGVDEYVEKWGGARDPRGIRDEKCYAKVKELLSPYPYTLMKTTFNEALNEFDDEFFDFIFIDGIAHEGQEGGRTFWEWFPKLKTGGVFAGRAYDPEYPQCIQTLNHFVEKNNLGDKFKVLTETMHRDYVKNWYLIK